MAGNVREWCRDAWRVYQGVRQYDPVGQAEEGKEPCYAIRGGSYETPTDRARVTWRTSSEGINYCLKEGEASPDLGFRVVLEVMTCPEIPVAPPDSTALLETHR
jgi:formylglycine-generating enzyme required for sulfatase activity